MPLELFGYQILKKSKSEEPKDNLKSFAPPVDDEGAINVTVGAYGSSTVFSYEGNSRTDRELINKYRQVAIQPEAEMAIDDIVNEAVVQDGENEVIQINLDRVTNGISDPTKKKIKDEFTKVKRLLNFENRGQDIFRRWYIDGRIYYHMIADARNPQEGIQELRAVDPRTIKKVKETKKTLDPRTLVESSTTKEFYVYSNEILNPTGSSSLMQSMPTASATVTIDPSVIVYVHSGLIDNVSNLVISFLHRALKVFNQLKMLEDATVIYTMVRAPERRVFYIDVGNLPKIKAEEYMKSLMNTYRNRIVYDASTGEIGDDRKHMHMMEDFWMPRREGGKGTEVTTLTGGNLLNDVMKQVDYFQKKFYHSLNVPLSRLQSDGGFNIGKSSEISRDELKFSKFVLRLRNKFNDLFLNILKYQLLLKNIIKEEDWNDIKDEIRFIYNNDMYFTQLKDLEIISEKMDIVAKAEPYVGRYFSKDYVQRSIMHFTEDEQDDQESLMNTEVDSGLGTAGGFEESPAKKPEPKLPNSINNNSPKKPGGSREFPKAKSDGQKQKEQESKQ